MDEAGTFEVVCPYEGCGETLVVDEAARAFASVTLDCEACGNRVGLYYGEPHPVHRDHAQPVGCLCCGRDEAAP